MHGIKGKYRKNDPVYLNRRLYNNPRESFKALVKKIALIYGRKPISLIDVGCASGAFLYYAKTKLRMAQGVGVDISEEHLRQARACVPDIRFIRDSTTSLRRIRKNQFDVCTCIGTLCIFDDIEPILRKLLGLLKKGGHLLIYDLVNSEPIDVTMRYRRAEAAGFSGWQSGLNVFSLHTYRRMVRRIGREWKISAFDFKLPISLPKRDDPMRAWTIRTADNPHQLVVGTGQLLNFKILKIHKARN